MDARDVNDEDVGARTAKSCGPDIPMLMSSWRQCFGIAPMMVARKPVHQGEREANRSNHRAGKAGAFRRTCGD